MSLKAIQFLALLATALALVPGGAHLFALPNKIGLDQSDYFTVQHIYSGWALFGIVLFAAILLDIVLAVMLRDQPRPFFLAVLAAICATANLIIFFLWTFPANRATSNWTVAPADWQSLRTAWEYSHAVNAGLTFVALCALILSALSVARALPAGA
jgi:hypothetical protein